MVTNIHHIRWTRLGTAENDPIHVKRTITSGYRNYFPGFHSDIDKSTDLVEMVVSKLMVRTVYVISRRNEKTNRIRRNGARRTG